MRECRLPGILTRFWVSDTAGSPRYRARIRCRYMLPETRRIVTLLRCRGRLKSREVASVPGEICEYFRQFLESLKSR